MKLRALLRGKGWIIGRFRPQAFLCTILLLGVGLLTGACSLRKMAVRSLGSALAASGSVYASDSDPELVGGALPFALETMESLLAQQPGDKTLLLAAAKGFAAYSFGFVQLEAERLRPADFERSQELRKRALSLYLRARDHALRGLEVDHPGIEQRLRLDPEGAVRELGRKDLDLTYWCGATWGAAISLGKDHPELLADLGAVRSLLSRVLALDETYGRGVAHEAFIALDALPKALGGDMPAARNHFQRAVALADGTRVSPFVAYAEDIAIQTQDRKAYVDMLERGLAVDTDKDPTQRLQNLLLKRKAQWMLQRVDEYFLEGASGDEEDSTGG